MSKMIVSVAGLALAAAASANTPFSASGQGGLIPASGTGGGTWPNYGSNPGIVTSSVTLSSGVKSISSVQIAGLTHTWIGDLQITLRDPSGNEYTIMHRPGYTGSGFGNGGDFTGGNYTFVQSGGTNIPTTVGSPGTNAPAGTYNQHFGNWASGTGNTFNTGLSSIAGAAGTWSLVIRDWAGGDSGAFSGWTLNGNYVPTPGAAALMGIAGLAGLRRRR